jgi:hypothetical protein
MARPGTAQVPPAAAGGRGSLRRRCERRVGPRYEREAQRSPCLPLGRQRTAAQPRQPLLPSQIETNTVRGPPAASSVSATDVRRPQNRRAASPWPVLPPCHIALTGTVYGLPVVGRAGSPARSEAAPPPSSLCTVDDVRKRLYSLLDEAPESPAVDADTSDDLICREEWSEEEEEEAGASAGGMDLEDDRARRRRAGTGYTTDDLGDDSDDSPALHMGTGGRRREQLQARNPPTNSTAAPTDVCHSRVVNGCMAGNLSSPLAVAWI